MANSRNTKTNNKTKKKSPTKVVVKPSRLKRLLPFLVILGFGLIGVVVINRSNAAAPPLQVFEAENMTVGKFPQDPSMPIVPDSGASKGITYAFQSNYIWAHQTFSVGNSNKIIVRARGQQCVPVGGGNAVPFLSVKLDNRTEQNIAITSTSYQYYNVPVLLPGGTHTITFSYHNDLWRPGVCDRNIFLDQFIISTPLPASATRPVVALPKVPAQKPAPAKKPVVTKKKVVTPPPPVAPADNFFTIITIPDTQNEAEDQDGHDAEMFDAQTAWIVRHKQEYKVAMVLHMGDVVNDLDNSREWQNSYAALSQLGGQVPYVVAAGNHDIINYNIKPVPIPRVSQTLTFDAQMSKLSKGSTYNVTGFLIKKNDYANTYTTFSAAGIKFLVLNVQYGAPSNVLASAGRIADKYSGYHAILLTHDFLGTRGLHGSSPADTSTPHQEDPSLNNPSAIWQQLVKTHPNIQFTFNGHVTDTNTTNPNVHMESRTNPAEQKRLGSVYWNVAHLVCGNAAGRPVYQTLANFQNFYAGDGYMRFYKFFPALNKVEVTTFSPQRAYNAHDISSNSLRDPANQFTYTGVHLLDWNSAPTAQCAG